MDNTDLSIVSQSSVYEQITNGQFDDAINELLANPEAFSLLIKAVDSNLSLSKGNTESIRDRSFFKKVFSNNIKDLADVLFQQNQTLAAIFVMSQIQSMSGAASAKLLGQLLENSKDEADTTGKEKGNLQQVAIKMLEYNTKELKKDEIRDQALMKCLRSAEILQETIDDIKKRLNEANINYEDCLASLRDESAKVILENEQELQKAKDSFDSVINSLNEEKTSAINEAFEKFTAFKTDLNDAIAMMNTSLNEKAEKEQMRIDEILSMYTKQVAKDKKRFTLVSIISLAVALSAIAIAII